MHVQLSTVCLELHDLLVLYTCAEMEFTREDTWGHFSPMFHLVDVFGVYSITMVGGRHIILNTFTARDALRAIGEVLCSVHVSTVFI